MMVVQAVLIDGISLVFISGENQLLELGNCI
jgi:hypothetical protein